PGAVLRDLVLSHAVGPLELGRRTGAERGDVAQRSVARDDEWSHPFRARHRKAVTSERFEKIRGRGVELGGVAAGGARWRRHAGPSGSRRPPPPRPPPAPLS